MSKKWFICDKHGWPVETIKGHRVQNFLRLLIHGRKLRRWTPETQSGASVGCSQERPKAEEQMQIIDVKSEIIEIDEDGNVTPANATVVRDSGDAHPTPKLTAEETLQGLARDLWRTMDEGLPFKHLRTVRRQAFEQAAEKAPELVRLIRNEGVFAGPYHSGYDTEDEAERVAVEVLADALRALAKE